MKGLLEKVKLNARALKLVGSSMATAGLVAMPVVFASGAGTGSKVAENLVKNLLGYVFAIFKYIGWLLLAWGIGQLILAFKNEDADSKSRAMMLLVVAVILTVIGNIFNGIMSSTIGGNIDTNKTI